MNKFKKGDYIVNKYDSDKIYTVKGYLTLHECFDGKYIEVEENIGVFNEDDYVLLNSMQEVFIYAFQGIFIFFLAIILSIGMGCILLNFNSIIQWLKW